MNLQDNESTGNTSSSAIKAIMSENQFRCVLFMCWCLCLCLLLWAFAPSANAHRENSLSIESPKFSQTPQPVDLMQPIKTTADLLQDAIGKSTKSLEDSERNYLPYLINTSSGVSVPVPWDAKSLLTQYRMDVRDGKAQEAMVNLVHYRELLRNKREALDQCGVDLAGVGAKCSALADLLNNLEKQSRLTEAQREELPVYRAALKLGQIHIDNCEHRMQRVRAEIKSMAAEIESPDNGTATNTGSKYGKEAK